MNNTIKEIEFTILNFPKRSFQVHLVLTEIFFKIFKELTKLLYNLFQKLERKHFPIFYAARITDIKTRQREYKKENHRPLLLMNIVTQILNKILASEINNT